MQLAVKIREARTRHSHRRAVRIAHNQLATELAAFTTAADRAELEQILDRHTADETREIREILSRRSA